MYPAGGIDGYSRDEFLEDLLREHETEIRRCLEKGAHKVPGYRDVSHDSSPRSRRQRSSMAGSAARFAGWMKAHSRNPG
ncbi:MAG: 5-methyltetrahydropteroyltriglutamate--homocysteine methyltransferase [Acidobacteriota bacterium]|jgi:hypothetical protein|nr:5-methyltetrahydropteroyltriglutamate--homocysteine methyltransferase [Acidobacteriota bacterium]